ncbi:NAD(P)H-binding [Gracilaria domingensis]|nr:NAD(P)H-binding [Gracilaria domingensis]
MTISILVIGASGRTGRRVIEAATNQQNPPQVHAFARNPASIPPEVAQKCASVQRGDALDSDDVYDALNATKATHIVISIGVPNSTSPSTLRGDTANAITQAMRRYNSPVKTVIVSALGASGTKIQYGFGVGMVIYFILRHLLKDHDRQEAIFADFYKERPNDLLIVRPTGLTEGKDGAKLHMFDGQQKTPTLWVDRLDVATWIVNQICVEGDQFGKAVNITRAQ